MVPLLQINVTFLSFTEMGMGIGTVVCGDWWEWGQSYALRGWMGTGTILKLVAGLGVGMGIRVPGMVGDGYKYLSPCSCLVPRLNENWK